MSALNRPEPDPRVAGYIQQTGFYGRPWLCAAYVTLQALGEKHGHELVRKLIDQHHAAMREYAVALKRQYAHERCGLPGNRV